VFSKRVPVCAVSVAPADAPQRTLHACRASVREMRNGHRLRVTCASARDRQDVAYDALGRHAARPPVRPREQRLTRLAVGEGRSSPAPLHLAESARCGRRAGINGSAHLFSAFDLRPHPDRCPHRDAPECVRTRRDMQRSRLLPHESRRRPAEMAWAGHGGHKGVPQVSEQLRRSRGLKLQRQAVRHQLFLFVISDKDDHFAVRNGAFVLFLQ
jgi:hypothetical protein